MNILTTITGKGRRIRPLHRRIALHTSSILLLLGGGFLPSPFYAQAVSSSYDVSARVPAPLPSGPATITSPFDQQHVTDPSVTVSGSCPDNSYVKIFNGADVAGIASCTTNAFSVPISLNPGANTLTAKVYNSTDDEGPTSPSITIFYDAPAPPPENPSSPPSDLSVSTIDGQKFALTKDGRFLLLSTQLPTFTGLAPAFSHIIITIHSNVVTCETAANKFGWWACTITEPLEPGDHVVHVIAITPDGRTLVYPDFSIRVYASGPKKTVPAGPTITIPYHFAIHKPGEQWQWNASISGGKAPYQVMIDWGDGNTQQFTRADGSAFGIAHTYNKAETYQPIVRVTDANGSTATFQLLAVVQDKTVIAPQFLGILSHLDPWVAWPIYAAIVAGIGIFWGYELYALHRHVKQRRAANQGSHAR